MAITPQAIKDQEFQTKFRGYDPIEVKGYLELVAEEFFELLEKVRQQEEEIEVLSQEKGLLDEMNAKLEDDIETALKTTDDVRKEGEEKDAARAELEKEIEELQTAQADLEEEQKEWEEEVIAAEGRVAEFEEKLRKSQSEKDTLQNKLEMLEEQIKELKGEEIDFKRTIGAAQRFVDQLKASAETEASELLQSSEEKAAAALQAARNEIERLRQDAFAELSRLPEEIALLNQQKRQVREDLRETLNSYLEQIDSFSEVDETVKEYEFDELFQKIELTDELTAALDEEVSDHKSSEELFDEGEELDLELPEDGEDDDDEDDQKDDLRKKLEEGGIAYLSDDS